MNRAYQSLACVKLTPWQWSYNVSPKNYKHDDDYLVYFINIHSHLPVDLDMAHFQHFVSMETHPVWYYCYGLRLLGLKALWSDALICKRKPYNTGGGKRGCKIFVEFWLEINAYYVQKRQIQFSY